jgi:uncharacterized protein YlzI (FlbEa/FlbD family)
MSLTLIKLTVSYSEPPIYINVDMIATLQEINDDKKMTSIELTNGLKYFVKETVEEIAVKINRKVNIRILL